MSTKKDCLEEALEKLTSFITKHFHYFTSILIGLIIFSILFVTACKDEITQPTPKPPGYQEDIPWPSLADSPWPMRHADPQSTGRSKSCGPMFGQVDWVIASQYLNSEPIISIDSIIYISFNDSLFAVGLNGIQLWKINLGFETQTTPILNSSNTIYASYNQGGIFAINKNSSINWMLNGNFDTQISLSKDGNILLFNENDALVSITPPGTIDWTLNNPNFSAGKPISQSPEGNTIYFSGRNSTLIAFDLISKTIKWHLGSSHYRGAPLIDNDGNIYLTMKIDTVNNGKVAFYSISKNGNIRWSYSHSEFSELVGDGIWNLHGEPTMDRDGNIYFGCDTLYSLDFDGNLRWKTKIEISPAASLVCDIDKKIYMIKDGMNNDFSVICLSSIGNTLWRIDNLKGESTSAGPIIAYSKLIVPTQDKYLYIFK